MLIAVRLRSGMKQFDRFARHLTRLKRWDDGVTQSLSLQRQRRRRVIRLPQKRYARAMV